MRKALSLGLIAVVGAGAFAPAVAAPKPKPITESYAVSGVPIPLPLVGSLPIEDSSSCMNPAYEKVSTTTKTIKPTAAGTLAVQLTGFTGDWDITVMNAKGEMIAIGDGSSTGSSPNTGGVTEKAVVKFKKGQEIRIAVCNFLGGPSAQAKYTYTYK